MPSSSQKPSTLFISSRTFGSVMFKSGMKSKYRCMYHCPATSS